MPRLPHSSKNGGWVGSSAQLIFLTLIVCFSVLSCADGASQSPSSLADTETCGDLRMSLSDQFRKQDCTREQHRSAGYDGTAWIETIESSNTEFFLFVVSQRAATSRSYFDGTNIEQLFGNYDLESSARMVGEPKSTMDGVEFVTIDNGNTCILFLKEAIPRMGGYGFLASGIGCERDKIGAYSEEDADRMISHIDFSVR